MAQVKGNGRFKLDFPCIKLTLANGRPMRALVITVAEPKPGEVSTHIIAGLALENGETMQMPIRRDLFLAAQVANEVVTMVEGTGEGDGTLTLFGANGRKLTWDRDDTIEVNTKG